MNTYTAISSIIFVLITIATVAHGQGDCSASDKCGECDVRDCDSDIQCAFGLICAAKHRGHLRNAGLNLRKAYCGSIGTRQADLCYDPVKVCISDADCDDTDSVNGVETCASGVCVGAVGCDDNSICTADILGEDGSCQYEPINCDDGNACTIDECFEEALGGCIYTEISCSEGETCDPNTGCLPGPAF